MGREIPAISPQNATAERLQRRRRELSDIGGIAGEHLRSYIQRIERLEEDKKDLAEDIKSVFAEARGTGFCVKTMKQILKLRKMNASDRQEQAHMLELYAKAVGVEGLPLFAG